MKTPTYLILGLATLFSQACVLEDDAPTGDELDVDSADSDGKADAPGSENYTFYSVRQDFRRCASPMCGGWFVSRVNRQNLKCHDGRTATECYVAEIDWSALGLHPDQLDGARSALQPLFKGRLQTRGYGEAGNWGVLQPFEQWVANSDQAADGVFVKVTDSGIRCITTPCNSLHEAKLNANLGADIAELDFSYSGATEDEISKAYDALANDGLLVSGYRYWYKERGTWAKGRDVTQFWRKLVPIPVGQVGDSCGGRGMNVCAADLYCAFSAEDACGSFDAPGECTVKPDACIQLYQPVCSCDGVTYGNACTAASNGASVAHDGECESAPQP